MNYEISFIIDLLPVFLGVGVMLLFRSINVNKKKVVIRTKGTITEDAYEGKESIGANTEKIPKNAHWRLLLDLPVKAGEVGIDPSVCGLWRGYLWDFDDMRSRIFKRVAYDALIVRGFRPKSIDRIDIDAFKELGLVDLSELRGLTSRFDVLRKEQLSIFAMDSKELLRCLFLPRSESSLLLPFIIDYNIDVYGQHLS